MKTAIKIKPEKYTFRRSIPIYLMLLPGLAYLIINNYLPMAGIVVAFKKLNFKLGIFGSPWNGLDNFKFLFASGSVGTMLRNTICYNLAFIVLGTIIPITVAILLNEIRSKAMARVYQTSILLPYLMSYVVVSYLAYAFLSVDTGFINKVLIPLFGQDKVIVFYQEKKYWPFILTFVHLWKGLGFSTVVYLASIVGISPELYEAARMDGASKWQRMWHVSLPCILPTIIIMFILKVGSIMSVGFEKIFLMQNSLNLGASQVISTYVYTVGIKSSQFSFGAAVGLFNTVINFVFLLITNHVSKKATGTGLM